jgi:hypothetical protein
LFFFTVVSQLNMYYLYGSEDSEVQAFPAIPVCLTTDKRVPLSPAACALFVMSFVFLLVYIACRLVFVAMRCAILRVVWYAVLCCVVFSCPTLSCHCLVLFSCGCLVVV